MVAERTVTVSAVVQQFRVRGGTFLILHNAPAVNTLPKLRHLVRGKRRNMQKRQVKRISFLFAESHKPGNVHRRGNAHIRILHGRKIFKMLPPRIALQIDDTFHTPFSFPTIFPAGSFSFQEAAR